jgi:hypothetical protein
MFHKDGGKLVAKVSAPEKPSLGSTAHKALPQVQRQVQAGTLESPGLGLDASTGAVYKGEQYCEPQLLRLFLYPEKFVSPDLSYILLPPPQKKAHCWLLVTRKPVWAGQ